MTLRIGDNWRLPKELRNKFDEVFEVVVFYIGLFSFIVDGQQVNGVVNDLDIGDNTSDAGLAFAFGSDRQPYFVAMIADGRSLIRMLPEGANELGKFFLREGYFLTRRLSCLSNGGMARTL